MSTLAVLEFANRRAGRIASCDPVRLQAPAPEAVVARGSPAWPSDLRYRPVASVRSATSARSPSTASTREPASVGVMLRHGRSSRVDGLAVSAGDHRTVCSAQPARADRRPPARACLNGRSGLAAWLRRIHRSVDRKRPHHFENAERCVAAGSGLAAPRWSGQETGDSGEAFRRIEGPGRPACDFHRACASAGHGARARQPAPLAARMMGHGSGLAAQHYAERDGLKGAALRPAGGGISW
jgi:hypothetical protein